MTLPLRLTPFLRLWHHASFTLPHTPNPVAIIASDPKGGVAVASYKADSRRWEIVRQVGEGGKVISLKTSLYVNVLLWHELTPLPKDLSVLLDQEENVLGEL